MSATVWRLLISPPNTYNEIWSCFWCTAVFLVLAQRQLTSPRESNDPACVLHNQAQGFSAWGRTVSMSRRQPEPDHCRRCRLLARPLTEISQLPARSNCAQNNSPAAIRLVGRILHANLFWSPAQKHRLVRAPC